MYNSYGSSSDLSRLGGLGATFWACYAIFILLALVLAIVIYWKVFSKAGYSGWLALLMFVPLVNFAMLLFLAFSDWPVLKELRDLRARVGSGAGGYAPPAGGYPPPAPSYPPAQQQYAPAPPAYTPPAPPAYAPPAPAPAPAPAPVEQPQPPVYEPYAPPAEQPEAPTPPAPPQ